MYRGGVYKKSGLRPAERTGYHSVRLIGWGEEFHQGSMLKYWVSKNAFNILMIFCKLAFMPYSYARYICGKEITHFCSQNVKKYEYIANILICSLP